MSDTATERLVCICGRAFSHCKNEECGSKNVYVKKARSFELTALLGRVVTVYGCRRCMRESTSEQECKAPSREFNPEFKAFSKEPVVSLPKWGHAVPGSIEHQVMLNDWITEHQHKGWSATQVYVEAQKAGWHLEYFGDRLDADVKQALVDRGLWIEQVANNQLEAPMRGAQDTQSPPTTAPIESPVSLDDIIKNMQENSK